MQKLDAKSTSRIVSAAFGRVKRRFVNGVIVDFRNDDGIQNRTFAWGSCLQGQLGVGVEN